MLGSNGFWHYRVVLFTMNDMNFRRLLPMSMVVVHFPCRYRPVDYTHCLDALVLHWRQSSRHKIVDVPRDVLLQLRPHERRSLEGIHIVPHALFEVRDRPERHAVDFLVVVASRLLDVRPHVVVFEHQGPAVGVVHDQHVGDADQGVEGHDVRTGGEGEVAAHVAHDDHHVSFGQVEVVRGFAAGVGAGDDHDVRGEDA